MLIGLCPVKLNTNARAPGVSLLEMLSTDVCSWKLTNIKSSESSWKLGELLILNANILWFSSHLPRRYSGMGDVDFSADLWDPFL